MFGSKIKLGSKVKCKVTNYVGTVTAKIEYLNKCVRYSVQSDVLKDGMPQDPIWIDADQLEVLNDKPVVIKKDKPTGGDYSNTPRSREPRR